MKKLSKLLALLLVLIMSVSLVACSGNNTLTEPQSSPEDRLREDVKFDVIAEIMLTYDATFNNLSVTNVKKTDTDNGYIYYEVNGKVTVSDKYGDKFEGKIDGEYKIREEDLENENADFQRVSLDIETPKRVD